MGLTSRIQRFFVRRDLRRKMTSQVSAEGTLRTVQPGEKFVNPELRLVMRGGGEIDLSDYRCFWVTDIESSEGGWYSTNVENILESVIKNRQNWRNRVAIFSRKGDTSVSGDSDGLVVLASDIVAIRPPDASLKKLIEG